MTLAKRLAHSCIFIAIALNGTLAKGNDVDLANKLANPISSLISVPFQFNYDNNIGPADGDRLFVNIQPVIPIEISEDWNLISRTIVPVISQSDVLPGTDQFGLGDIVQSAFFSPKASTNGITWGVGPVALFPTGTDDALGSGKFGLGPTAVALIQNGPLTVGALANHIWSVAGQGSRRDVNATFIQPFVNYTLPTATSFFVNTETTYDWAASEASIPLNFGVNQLIDISGQKVQVGLGGRYWIDAPASGPEGWGARMNVVFLFPK